MANRSKIDRYIDFFKGTGKNFKLQFTNIFARFFLFFIRNYLHIFTRLYRFSWNHDPTKSKVISGEYVSLQFVLH